MREECYCGRIGENEDRKPVATSSGERALRCPDCGHLDQLNWLPDEAQRRVFEGAKNRQPRAA